MNEYQFKKTNIKGKDYVEVNQRVIAFRRLSEYKGFSLETELVAVDAETCIVKAIIKSPMGDIVATGYAQEDKASSNINRTSYVENCETSAVGRALGFLGIGIETSIATADEVSMAIAKQDAATQTKQTTAQDADDLYTKCINHIKGSPNKKEAYEQVIAKYGATFTENQRTGLSKFVR